MAYAESNKQNLNEGEKAEIYLYGIQGNSINTDSDVYDKEAQFVDIYALNKNNQRVNNTKDVNNIRYSRQIQNKIF